VLHFDRSTVKRALIATSDFLTALECTNSFSAGVPPRTPLGELTALLRPLAEIGGPASKGKERGGRGEERDRREGTVGEGKERERRGGGGKGGERTEKEGRGRKGRGRERRGRKRTKGKGRKMDPPFGNSWIRPCIVTVF